MSFMGRVKKEWGFESNVPRCFNCVAYRKPNTFLRNSLPVQSPPMCSLGLFMTTPNSCCDKWVEVQLNVRKPKSQKAAEKMAKKGATP